jgi:hypothetical protein
MVDHPGLMFVRRASESGHQYFIANHGEQPLDQWVSLGTHGSSAKLMDPVTGRTGLASFRQAQQGADQVYLQLQPGQSIILRTFTGPTAQEPPWVYSRMTGKAIEVAGTWQVKFLQGGPAIPAGFQTAKLASWTQLGDAAAQSFAGTTSYAITFDSPNASADRWLLDLGVVCQSARVRLNGRDLETLFAAPFQIPLDRLQPKANVLEVEVTNLSANRIRDLDRRGVQWRNFHDINFATIGYGKFDASNWPLLDSGLLGPVTLTPIATLNPAGR